MLKKRDQENVRLREQRDQQVAEINERKAQNQVKQMQVDECQKLAVSRAVRTIIRRQLIVWF